MTNLPIVPKPGTALVLEDIEVIEARVAQQVREIDDVQTLEEWRAQAAALEAYLRGKELNGPMLGAQRRVEARIGQLLGGCTQGTRADLTSPHAVKSISSTDRQRFRILARGLEHGLSEEDWRNSRTALVALIQQRYPMPRHVPTTVTKKGGMRKPLAERAKEVASLAAGGHRAAQIADRLEITEQQVRSVAKQAEIKLPDDAIGKRRKPDAARILRETINGIDAYVSGLSLLDGTELPALGAAEITELTQALARSINGLRKLRLRMEKSYAGTHAPAA